MHGMGTWRVHARCAVLRHVVQGRQAHPGDLVHESLACFSWLWSRSASSRLVLARSALLLSPLRQTSWRPSLHCQNFPECSFQHSHTRLITHSSMYPFVHSFSACWPHLLFDTCILSEILPPIYSIITHVLSRCLHTTKVRCPQAGVCAGRTCLPLLKLGDVAWKIMSTLSLMLGTCACRMLKTIGSLTSLRLRTPHLATACQ